MKPDKHATGESEPKGRMVNNNGHWEYFYDDPVMNRPAPPARPERERHLRAVTPSATPRPATPADPAGDTASASRLDDAPPYTPVALRARHDGWTAERQRNFLTVLAETGSISMACAYAGVSSRSAYRLRGHPRGEAFAKAWDAALKLATARLTALAYERATRGTVKEVWVEGELKSTTRAPSDKLLMFLLQHLLPAGRPGDRWSGFEAMATEARAGFPGQLDGLVDQDIAMVPIDSRDYFGEAPGDQNEDG